MSAVEAAATKWLRAFARAVRDRDFAAGRRLFDDDALGFGTVGVVLRNLDDLEARQWRAVWPVTEKFDFDYDSAQVFGRTDVVTIAVRWSSLGLAGNREVGSRCGRSTLVLRRDGDEWRAIHTHFSLDPE